MITREQYFGPYLHSPDATPERMAHADVLLAATNAALELARADGLELPINHYTGCQLGGSGHGGFRDQACAIGAPQSSHKQGQGIDIYDPRRELASWSLRNQPKLIELGIVAMENPRWTPTWCHWQTRVVVGKFSFIPDASAPKAPELPEQVHVA